MLSNDNSFCASQLDMRADWLVATDSIWWTCGHQSFSNHQKVHEGRQLRSPLSTLPKTNDCSSFAPQCGVGMMEKRLCKYIFIGGHTYQGNKRHTGVVLVSRWRCLPSVNLSANLWQTISLYTPGLEGLAVWYLYVNRNERYGRELRWSAAQSRYRLGCSLARMHATLSSGLGCSQALFVGNLSRHVHPISLGLVQRATWDGFDLADGLTGCQTWIIRASIKKMTFVSSRKPCVDAK